MNYAYWAKVAKSSPSIKQVMRSRLFCLYIDREIMLRTDASLVWLYDVRIQHIEKALQELTDEHLLDPRRDYIA